MIMDMINLSIKSDKYESMIKELEKEHTWVVNRKFREYIHP